MQTRASDIAYQNAMRSHMYTPMTFSAPYYPRSPYSLRGLAGHGVIPGPPYCTDVTYDQLLQMFNVEDCTTYDAAGDVQGSADCVARNAPKLYGATNSVSWWQQNCTENAGPQNTTITTAPVTPTGYSGPTIYAPGPGGSLIPDTGYPATGAPSSTGNYNPTVSFQGSRAGLTFQPGDTWQITITGGAPNTLVSVTGVHNGATATNQMGTTDQNGNFSLSGTFDTSVIGNWSETWYVGTQTAGTFQFSVVAGNSAPAGTGTPPATQQQPVNSYPTPGSSAGQTPTGMQQQPAPSGGTTNTTPATSTDLIPGVSNTYLALGAGALLLVLVAAGGK
jgi:hypothetical protein